MTLALEIYGVLDAGVPNLERIALRSTGQTNLASYFLGIGFPKIEGGFIPLNDSSLWLGSGYIESGDWLYVFTGPGMPRSEPINDGPSKIYSIHWGRKSVLFRNGGYRPYLMRIETFELAPETPPAISGYNAGQAG